LTFDLVLDGRPVLVLLEGSTEPLLDGWSLLPSTNAPPNPDRAMAAKDRQALLRAWMDHLLLAAAGLSPHHGGKVLGAPKTGAAGVWTVAPPEVSRDDARDQLARWVIAAFTERRWTLLPIEGALECLDSEKPDLASWLEKTLDNDRVGFSSVYGPLPRAAQSEDVVVEPDWQAITNQRLGTFPAWSQQWEEVQ